MDSSAPRLCMERQPRALASGPLHLRYSRAENVASFRDLPRRADRRTRALAAAEARIARRAVPGISRTAAPHMSFSPTGLSFDDGLHVEEGEVLLLEIGLPGEPQAWRATARVVRVTRIPIDERDDGVGATHR